MRTYHRLKKRTGDSVMDKFNNTCAICGSINDLCVHHIIKMKPNDSRYNDIENLTVLCRGCHMSIHRKAKDIVQKTKPSGNKFGRRGNRPPIKCSMDGCDNIQHAKALCKKHYEQKRRNNNI